MSGSTVRWGTSSYPSLKKDEWCHITITWGDGKVTIYNNGKYATHAADMPANLPRWTDPENQRFSIADNDWTSKGGNKTAFDELMIFNQPLAAPEVMALYQANSLEKENK